MDVHRIIKDNTVTGKGLLIKCYFDGDGSDEDPYYPIFFNRYSGSIMRIVKLNTAKKIGIVCIDASRATSKELEELRRKDDLSIISVLGECGK